MSDTTKTEDDKEPIDAEFETLDEADAEDAKAKKRQSSPLLQIGLAAFAIIVLIFALSFLGVNVGKMFGKEKSGDEARVNALSAQIGALQSDLTTLKQQEEKTHTALQARLDVLENKPAPVALDDQAIADLQERLVVLENAAPTNAPDTAALDALTQRLNQVDARLQAINTGVDASVVETGVIGTLRHRISALEQAAPATISGQSGLATVAQVDTMQSEITALGSRISALENAKPATDNKTALALSLLALDSAAQSGAPFVREWQSLSQLLPQNADVLVLAPLARTGVPGHAALTREFAKHINAIRAASGQNSGEKPGMMGKAKAAFGSLVSVRRVDGRAMGVDAVLAAAETALENGDLNGAIAALGNLDDGARKAAQGWLTQAQARLTLEQALARLKIATAEVNP